VDTQGLLLGVAVHAADIQDADSLYDLLKCAVSRHHFNFRNAISMAYSRTWMCSRVTL
jgi:hypothetical protein